ncbi:hypothetical protein AB4Y45_32620 [Paraburkholderia sp. EG287A]|uniref:hypothetical protein n=1 Tax=Paraburkholderia sp. EG287A TaxID=3237012 RepID=UPI0034D196A1
MAKITFVNGAVGNNITRGFVNFVSEDGKRFSIGTGSYVKKGTDEKVFKASVTVFVDDNFDGELPKLKDYVEVSGDMTSTPRQNAEGLVYNDKGAVEMNHSYNVRFAKDFKAIEAPKKKDAPAPAGAEQSNDDI